MYKQSQVKLSGHHKVIILQCRIEKLQSVEMYWLYVLGKFCNHYIVLKEWYLICAFALLLLILLAFVTPFFYLL